MPTDRDTDPIGDRDRDDGFQRALHRQDFHSMDTWTKHEKLMRDFYRFHRRTSAGGAGGAGGDGTDTTTTITTEVDVVRRHHRFLRTAADDRNLEGDWERRVAKKYYDKLFKEYAVADLTRYREHRVGLRWRTEREVLHAKGQLRCGRLGCDQVDGRC